MNNPFDQLEIARDLVRRDECQHLFGVVRKVQTQVLSNPEGWHDPLGNGPVEEIDAAYTRGVIRGMEIMLNELDERIGWLRDRWG